MCESNIQFDEEQCGQIDVVVSPELTVVKDSDAMMVVANIDCEPNLFDREPHALWHEVPLSAQAFDDLFNDPLAEKDHAQPAEGGYPADCIRNACQWAGGGVTLAKGLVAVEGEDAGGFVGLLFCL